MMSACSLSISRTYQRFIGVYHRITLYAYALWVITIYTIQNIQFMRDGSKWWELTALLTCFGIPILVGFGWISWMKRVKNAFKFLQRYLIGIQSGLLIWYLFSRVFGEDVTLIEFIMRAPYRYWYVFVYIFSSLALIILYLSKFGRTRSGARISGVFSVITLIFMFGVELFVTGDYVGWWGNVAFMIIRFLTSFMMILPQGAWAYIFGNLPATIYITDEGVKTNIYNEETSIGRLTKWMIESLKEADIREEPT